MTIGNIKSLFRMGIYLGFMLTLMSSCVGEDWQSLVKLRCVVNNRSGNDYLQLLVYDSNGIFLSEQSLSVSGTDTVQTADLQLGKGDYKVVIWQNPSNLFELRNKEQLQSHKLELKRDVDGVVKYNPSVLCHTLIERLSVMNKVSSYAMTAMTSLNKPLDVTLKAVPSSYSSRLDCKIFTSVSGYDAKGNILRISSASNRADESGEKLVVEPKVSMTNGVPSGYSFNIPGFEKGDDTRIRLVAKADPATGAKEEVILEGYLSNLFPPGENTLKSLEIEIKDPGNDPGDDPGDNPGGDGGGSGTGGGTGDGGGSGTGGGTGDGGGSGTGGGSGSGGGTGDGGGSGSGGGSGTGGGTGTGGGSGSGGGSGTGGDPSKEPPFGVRIIVNGWYVIHMNVIF